MSSRMQYCSDFATRLRSLKSQIPIVWYHDHRMWKIIDYITFQTSEGITKEHIYYCCYLINSTCLFVRLTGCFASGSRFMRACFMYMYIRPCLGRNRHAWHCGIVLSVKFGWFWVMPQGLTIYCYENYYASNGSSRNSRRQTGRKLKFGSLLSTQESPWPTSSLSPYYLFFNFTFECVIICYEKLRRESELKISLNRVAVIKRQ